MVPGDQPELDPLDRALRRGSPVELDEQLATEAPELPRAERGPACCRLCGRVNRVGVVHVLRGLCQRCHRVEV
jgi:hypothetical protein